MAKTFIGTFGLGHETHSKVFQPIEADGWEQAQQLMTEKHGLEWAFIYPVADYKQHQDDGLFKGHQPLKYIGGGQNDRL